jgi:hypothetical protein
MVVVIAVISFFCVRTFCKIKKVDANRRKRNLANYFDFLELYDFGGICEYDLVWLGKKIIIFPIQTHRYLLDVLKLKSTMPLTRLPIPNLKYYL